MLRTQAMQPHSAARSFGSAGLRQGGDTGLVVMTTGAGHSQASTPSRCSVHYCSSIVANCYPLAAGRGGTMADRVDVRLLDPKGNPLMLPDDAAQVLRVLGVARLVHPEELEVVGLYSLRRVVDPECIRFLRHGHGCEDTISLYERRGRGAMQRFFDRDGHAQVSPLLGALIRKHALPPGIGFDSPEIRDELLGAALEPYAAALRGVDWGRVVDRLPKRVTEAALGIKLPGEEVMPTKKELVLA